MTAAARIAVEDRLDLLELHGRLAGAIDSGDAAGWAALFTADGFLRTSRGTELRGREELTRFAADWFERFSGSCRHLSWNHVFEADGDEVTATCYAALLRRGDGAVTIDFTAFYRDRYRRLPEGWRLHERVVTIDPTPTEGD
ncbi:MAG: nuclear transport factor 2 family protein [Actinobacteria bacterium]|nr:nuclear transport factor 2 family protein [Actinomycetota bacterium]